MADLHPHYIEFRHVYKTFDRPVLVDSCFHVDSGQTVAIIGRSGVGKSVTLAHIMGFLKPDQGRIIVGHEDITDFDEAELNRIRRKVTMVFQSGALFDSMTVAENVRFALETNPRVEEADIEPTIDLLLQKVDILDARDSFPADIPTGYRRAVAIARALAAEPECVLYDEPTTMVDPIMSEHMTRLIMQLKQSGLTSVVVTHDLDLMNAVADRVVFLSRGHVAFFGTPADLYRSEDESIAEFLELDKTIRGPISASSPFLTGIAGGVEA